MDKILTPEEFLKSDLLAKYTEKLIGRTTHSIEIWIAILYARYCIEKALELAAEKGTAHIERDLLKVGYNNKKHYTDGAIIDKDSILSLKDSPLLKID